MDGTPRFKYDVFISYARADGEWTPKVLLPRLEKAGLKCALDTRDFRPGAPTLTEIERCIEESRNTLLVLTPTYLTREWTEFENLIVQTISPANRDRRLIPLLKEECEPPPRIRALTYVNFANPDDPEWPWTQLITALGGTVEYKTPEEPTRKSWLLAHPYGMPPNFTGRVEEREMLTRWLNHDADNRLFVLRALGGFGKSALCWRWLMRDVDPRKWPRVVWWSFYEGDAGFETFMAETLDYLSGGNKNFLALPPRHQMDALLQLLHKPGVLLVLDGFERALRAYTGLEAAYQGDEPSTGAETWGDALRQRDCTSPMAEAFFRHLLVAPGIRGKTLMTTRLRPRAVELPGDVLLEGCLEKELNRMQPADAVAFFQAQGVRGSRAEIEQACDPYGYHPLSIRLLAGLIAGDLEKPGDIAAARRLDITGDLIQRRHHVLQQAHGNLGPGPRSLLGRIACFRGPVGYDALISMAENGKTIFKVGIRYLFIRGLLNRDEKNNRFDLHPIVRRYAYDRLTGEDRTDAHQNLRDYFAAVETPDKVEKIEDLNPVIELYHHTVRAGRFDEARDLFRDRLHNPLYYQFGAYQLQIELLRTLFPDGENRPPRLKDKSDQAWMLTALANSYSLNGQPRRAVPLFERQNEIQEKQDNKKNLAIGLGNLAIQQMISGILQSTEDNLRRRIKLSREIKNEFNEAIGRRDLGRLLTYRGGWANAEHHLTASIKYREKTDNYQGLSLSEAYRAQKALLMARQFSQQTIRSPNSSDAAEVRETALTAARQALEMADKTARTRHPYERDYVRAHWLLGAAHRVNGHLPEADRHLTEALTRCRGINLVEIEADILLDLARLRAETGNREEALQLARDALTITERSGYVLQGADVHLFLAETALSDNDLEAALEYAQKARDLARCDGPPDYTYKVAWDEAGILLDELSES